MAKIGFLHGNANALRQALSELNTAKALCYVLLERVDRIRLARFAFEAGTDHVAKNPDEQFTDWEEGRFFGPLVELRWRKEGDDAYHLCCLSDDDSIFPSNVPIVSDVNLSQYSRFEQQHYLWGVFEDDLGAWYDERIPQFLSYPLPAPTGRRRAILQTVEYTHLAVSADGTNSEERFIRWQDLKEA